MGPCSKQVSIGLFVLERIKSVERLQQSRGPAKTAQTGAPTPVHDPKRDRIVCMTKPGMRDG